MNKMLRNFTALVIGTIVTGSVFISGCSKQPPAIPEKDKAAFGKAIAGYCKAKNMGMVIKSFDKADIKEGSTAVVTCKMKAADGPGISAKWTFKMKKENDSWVIQDVDR